MHSKAFVLAVVLPIVLLVSVGYSLSWGLRTTGATISQKLQQRGVASPPHAGTTGALAGEAAAATPLAAEASLPARGFQSKGRHIYRHNGRRWRPHGAELLAISACDGPNDRPDVQELKDEADRLVRRGVNLLRIPLEPWQDAGSWSHPDDVEELLALVQHVVQRPGVAVLLAASAPMGAAAGADDLPRQRAFWREVVELFAHEPQVIFDLSLSQQAGERAASEAAVAHNINALLAEIRASERALGVPMHLVAVQGSGASKNNRARDYYQGAPLPAAKAGNVVWVGQRPNYVRDRPGFLYVSPAPWR